MVYDIMNGFKEKLSFVDLLKPEMPAVVLILLAIKPFMGALRIPGAALKVLGAAGNSVISMIRRKVAGHPLGPKPGAGVTASDADYLETFLSGTFPDGEPPNDWEVEVFLGSSEVLGVTDPTLGPKLTKIRLWFLSWALQSLARFQAIKQGEEFLNADHPHNPAAIGARSRLAGDVKLVVFGHTHEALKTEFSEGLYVNCGTWADLVALPRDDREAMQKWLHDVAANKFERTAYPTYVKIRPASGGIDVSLNLWTDAGEKQLWAKNI
jgi:hypothetical protein